MKSLSLHAACREKRILMVFLSLCNCLFGLLPRADRMFTSPHSLSFSSAAVFLLFILTLLLDRTLPSFTHPIPLKAVSVMLSLLTFCFLTAVLLRLFQFFYRIFLFV